MRRWFGALVVLLSLAGAGVAAAAPTASASTACQVINKQTKAGYGDLQEAIDAAAAGATLFVQGTCTTSQGFIIDQNLTLIGQQPAGYTVPTLSGPGNAGPFGQSLVTIFGVVTIKSLTITSGNSGVSSPSAGDGGGIFNGGTLTLNETSITGNTAFFAGGGIYNMAGTVTLKGSTVTGNTAANDNGGGIYNNGGTVTLKGSTVTGNTAPNGTGGGIYNPAGTLNGAKNGINVYNNIPDNIS